MPMGTKGPSLNDEALRTLLAEVESIFSSRPQTVEPFSDVNSHIPLYLSTLLKMKTSVVISSPVILTKPDLYYKRGCRLLQQTEEEF